MSEPSSSAASHVLDCSQADDLAWREALKYLKVEAWILLEGKKKSGNPTIVL